MIDPLLLKFPLLGKLPWRLIGIAALALLVWWKVHAYGERREQEGRAAVQALWEADTAARDKVTAEALSKAEADRAAAVAAERKVLDELEQTRADAVAGRTDVERLLRATRSEVSACTSNRATDRLAFDAAAAERRAGEIDAAVAGVVTEHRLNAAQLAALQTYLREQRVCPVVVE